MSIRPTAVFAWCLYDWAVTPFPTIVVTFVISNYFAKAIAPDEVAGSAQWSFMIALSGIVIAVASPALGAVADRLGHARRGIAASLGAIVLAGVALWYARPEPDSAPLALLSAAGGIVALELGLLFYNALLPVVAPASRLGRISGWGWAAGYSGGLVCLGLALVLLVQPEQPAFGIGRDHAANIRACGPLVAIWAALFGWPILVFAPDTRGGETGLAAALRRGFADLAGTAGRLRAIPGLARYLLASALYRDGVTTILTVGGLYAGGTFGMGFSELIRFAIGLNVMAGLGTASFAWLDDRLGSKRTILLSLAGLILFGMAIIAVHDKTWFFALGLGLGVFVGPAQAASRSMLVRLSPPGEVARFFGLYALTGRAVSFAGPALFGWATEALHSQRAGIATILVLLIAGGWLLLGVREPAERDLVSS
jgi:UMF1 family MFS transporter